MANPQVENGHTQIANEILEHLMQMHLSPNHWQVLLYIIRKTYGFHKKVDYIANSQIVQATGLCKAVVSRCLSGLNDMEMIIRKGKFIGFQKDWERWKLAISSTITPKVSSLVNNQELAEQSTLDIKLAEQSTSKKLAISSTELAISSTKVSSPAVAQKIKDTLTKDNNTVVSFKKTISDNLWLSELKERFPSVDVSLELVKMQEWLSTSMKVYKNYRLFILNWLQKAQNHSGHQEIKKDFDFDRDYNPHVVPK